MEQKTFWNKVVDGLKWFFHSYIWLFVIFFAIDLTTKLLVVNYFSSHTEPIVLIGTAEKPFLQINYSINTAAAFGLGLPSEMANRVLYCVIAFIGLSLIVGFYVWKFKKINSLVKACLMLMAVGALGNMVDRIFYTPVFLHNTYNGVVDWIDFAGIWQFIFNIADSCVVVGTLILLVYLIVDEVKTVKAARAKEVKETGGKVLSKEEQSRLEEKPAEEPAKEESAKEEEKPVSESK